MNKFERKVGDVCGCYSHNLNDSMLCMACGTENNGIVEHMTKFKAIFIKSLRVKQGYSWRAVERELYTRYDMGKPFNSQITTGKANSNQIDGEEACSAAMEFLNEEVKDGWN